MLFFPVYTESHFRPLALLAPSIGRSLNGPLCLLTGLALFPLAPLTLPASARNTGRAAMPPRRSAFPPKSPRINTYRIFVSIASKGLTGCPSLVESTLTKTTGRALLWLTTPPRSLAPSMIVNAIQLPVPGAGTATMFGLQADDFVTRGGGSVTSAATQTLLVAIGQLPFVMADPTLSGLTAVLYPPNSGRALSQAPLQMTSADGTTTYQIQLGRAVVLATIPVTDNKGNTTNNPKHVMSGELNGRATRTPPQPKPDCRVQKGFYWDVAILHPAGSPWKDVPASVFWNGPVARITSRLENSLNGMH